MKGGTGDGDIRTQTEFGTLRQHDNKDNTKNKNKTSIRISAIRAAPTSSSRAAAAASGSRRPSAIKVAAAEAVASVPKTIKAVAVAVGRWRRQEEGQVPEESQSPVLPELDRCPAASPEAAIANEKGGWLKPTAFHFKCRLSDVDKSADLSDVRQEASMVSGFRRAPRARSLESALT